jgi:hypothetical protein
MQSPTAKASYVVGDGRRQFLLHPDIYRRDCQKVEKGYNEYKVK